MSGFFDVFQDQSGLDWIKANEKEELIQDKTPLQVVSAGFSAAGQFGPKYFLVFELDGATRAISFGKSTEEKPGVESRDNFFEALIEYLATDDNEPPVVYLERVGRSVLIKNAEALAS